MLIVRGGQPKSLFSHSSTYVEIPVRSSQFHVVMMIVHFILIFHLGLFSNSETDINFSISRYGRESHEFATFLPFRRITRSPVNKISSKYLIFWQKLTFFMYDIQYWLF